MAGTTRDAVDLLVQDHQEIRQMMARMESAKTGEQKEEIFHDLVRELAVHETAEEEILYPTLRRDVPGGSTLADARIAEEKEAEKLLADMEKMDPGSAEFDAAFAKLKRAVEAHASAEEREVFSKLRSEESSDRLESMARLLDLAKKTAPTHPHPTVPGTATARMAAGPLAAVIDRTRDAIREAREKLTG